MWAQYLFLLFGQVALQMDPPGDAKYGDIDYILSHKMGKGATASMRMQSSNKQVKHNITEEQRVELCTLCGMDIEGVGVLDLTHRASNECVTYHYKRWQATEVTQLVPHRVLRYNVLTYNTVPIWSSWLRFIKKITWIHERSELLDALQIETVDEEEVPEYVYLLKRDEEWVISSFVEYAQVMNACLHKVTLDIVRDDYKCNDAESSCLTTRRVIEPDLTQLIGKIFLDDEPKWDYDDYKPKYCCRIIRYLGDVHDVYVKIYMFGENGIEGPIEFINNDGRWRPKPKFRLIFPTFRDLVSGGDDKGGESAAGSGQATNAQDKSAQNNSSSNVSTRHDAGGSPSTTKTPEKVVRKNQNEESLSEEMSRLRNEMARKAKVDMLRKQFENHPDEKRINPEALRTKSTKDSSERKTTTFFREAEERQNIADRLGSKASPAYIAQKEVDDDRSYSGEYASSASFEGASDLKKGGKSTKVFAHEGENDREKQKSKVSRMNQVATTDETTQQNEALIWGARPGNDVSRSDTTSGQQIRTYDRSLRIRSTTIRRKQQRDDESVTANTTVDTPKRHADDSSDEEGSISVPPRGPSDALRRRSLGNIEECINDMVHKVIVLADRNMETQSTTECILHVLEGAAERICLLEDTEEEKRGPEMLLQVRKQCEILTSISKNAQAATQMVADDAQSASEYQVNAPGSESDEVIPVD